MRRRSEARSLALGDKGTVFVSNRNLTDVYAIVDRGGKREVKKLLKGFRSPNGIAFDKARCTSPSGTGSRATTASRTLDIRAIRKSSPTLSTREPGRPLLEVPRDGPDGKLYFNVGSPGNIVMPSYMQRRSSVFIRRPA